LGRTDTSHEGHSHSHEGHSHGVSSDADERYLAIALALLVGFMLVEVVVGSWPPPSP
jgi:cobalt-zinc-cadmium efflux system protein